MIIRISVISCILISLNAFGQDNNRWIYYFENSEGQLWYYDYETAVRDSKSNAYVWVKVEYSIPVYDTYRKKYKTKVLLRFKIECYNYKIGIMSGITYFDDGTLFSYDNDYVDMETVAPETMGESLFKEFCK